ncbi:MAG: MoxR-like ATPase, regulator [Bacteroidota bacterium]|jgi:MoxR-like ATPase
MSTEETLNESPQEQVPPTPEAPIADGPELAVLPVMEAADAIRDQIGRVLIGQDELVTHLLTGLFAGGHMLLEGVPGIAKTLTAKLLAKTMQLDYSRIQFTPDLMPSDVTGTSVFNLKTSEFTFNRGPIFANVVLIDEINRAPAKTQAALFEVMEEQQITVDGTTYSLASPFIVLATQNPIEQEGTYRLPEAQLDRFLFRIRIDYPNLEQEIAILGRFRDDFSKKFMEQLTAVLNPSQIAHIRQLVENVHIKDELLGYIARIVYQTRNDSDLFLGASPRASLAILRASKAFAAINGRSFVIPDDIRHVAIPVLNHRIQLSPEREMEGLDSVQVIQRILQQTEVPR